MIQLETIYLYEVMRENSKVNLIQQKAKKLFFTGLNYHDST